MNKKLTRRDFVGASLALSGLSLLPNVKATGGVASRSDNFQQGLTIQEVIETIKQSIPISKGLMSQTVDTVKIGDATKPVTGIVTTMFATIPVIRKSIELNANLIIAHEPTFYNHLDETNWLEDDEVYQYKKLLATENNIVVWRFHDYWHSNRPDGVRMGVLEKLGWKKYYNESNPAVMNIPSTSLKELVQLFKTKLGITKVKVVGDLKQSCVKIGLLPGAIGGKSQIQFMKMEKPDLLIVGELQEWETSEYFRDLRATGKNQSLLVLGHAVSEEPGMEWLVSWLRPKVPSVKVTHVPSTDPFTWV